MHSENDSQNAYEDNPVGIPIAEDKEEDGRSCQDEPHDRQQTGTEGGLKREARSVGKAFGFVLNLGEQGKEERACECRSLGDGRHDHGHRRTEEAQSLRSEPVCDDDSVPLQSREGDKPAQGERPGKLHRLDDHFSRPSDPERPLRHDKADGNARHRLDDIDGEHDPVISEPERQGPDQDQGKAEHSDIAREYRREAQGALETLHIGMHESLHRRYDREHLVGPDQVRLREEGRYRPRADQQEQAQKDAAGNFDTLCRRHEVRVVAPSILDHQLPDIEIRRHVDEGDGDHEGARDAVILDRDQPGDEDVAQEAQDEPDTGSSHEEKAAAKRTHRRDVQRKARKRGAGKAEDMKFGRMMAMAAC